MHLLLGSGTTVEVVSLQIMNTPEIEPTEDSAASLECSEEKKGSIQPYIPAFHTILQETVVSGLIGRYYLYGGLYLHVRWD